MATPRAKTIPKKGTKLNYEMLFIKYLKSDIMSVQAFFEEHLGRWNGGIKLKTKGWGAEKEGVLQNARLKAKEKITEEYAELYVPNMKEISDMHKAIIGLMKGSLFSLASKMSKDEKGNVIMPEGYDVREAEIMWRIVKVEKGEATEITTGSNDNPLKRRLDEMKKEKQLMVKN